MTSTPPTTVILGGSSGIGLAIAQALDASGTRVIITGRDPEKLTAATHTLSEQAHAEAVDALDLNLLQAFYARQPQFDHLVIALSGGAGGGPFRDLDLADLRSGFEAKFWPHVQSAQAALPHLRADGSITFITAVSARMASPGTAGLAAINGAIETMIPTLARELAPLRVNAVSPGVIDTPWWNFLPSDQKNAAFQEYAGRTPVGRVGQPSDVAHAARFLIENTFVTGTVIACDGGLRLAP